MIRVLLVDDQPLIRGGIRALLEIEADIDVVGEASDGAGAVELAGSLRPDVILMDIRMPGMDGLEATRRIAADPALAAVHVVILTTFDLDEYVFEAIRLGAAGFLVKNSEPAELARGVRAAATGEALLSPGATRRLIGDYAARAKQIPDAVHGLDQLTDRERQVLALVAEGLTNADIAERLVVSPLTAKTHVSRILGKLSARDRAHLVVIAYESGLVQPGWRS